MNIKFEITEDGSHTLFVPELNEHYHSTHGAIQESMHVFIDAGLRHCVKSEIKVLEIGFGTGLNAFLTLLEAERTGRKIDYTTLEFYPLLIIDAEKLNYAELTDSTKKDVFRELHKVEWGKWSQLTLYFSLLKMKFDFSKPSDFDTENKFDVIFFDAFAPEKQPEMWVQEIFDKIYSISSENAILQLIVLKAP